MEKKPFELTENKKYGFLQIDPTPSAEEIARFYAEEFYASDYPRLNDSKVKVQQQDKAFYDSRWQDMCETVFEHFNLKEKGIGAGVKVLDVGCGWGQALLYFKAKDFDCYGFDPALEAVEYAQHQGLNVVQANMETMQVFPGIKFEVVTLINVLEHLADPITVIQTIRDEVLSSNGLLIIDVPNEFNDFQVAGQQAHDLPQWWVVPPAHLNYFSRSSLQSLLEGEGFTVFDAQASFPLEMFLLFGDNYVQNSKLGRSCHLKRVRFETNLRKQNKADKLKAFNRAMAELDLGRQIVMYACISKV